MSIVILGIDLGKNVCSLVGIDAAGAVIVRRSMRRQTLIDYVAKLPACVVAMEACCGAHHLGRLFAAHGHEIRLMSPEYVRPYVKAQKNDDRDAEGIAEAASRPTMRFIPLKNPRSSWTFRLSTGSARAYLIFTSWNIYCYCSDNTIVQQMLSNNIRTSST